MRYTIIVPAIALAVGACRPQEPTAATAFAPGHHHSSVAPASAETASVQSEIARLRAATARFHDFSAAQAAGMGTQMTNCFKNPGVGAMGYHYADPQQIDAVLDPLKPEFLLYEPQKDGTLKFVAVEFAVPFGLWTSEEPPQLFGQSFHRNYTFGLWILHVWHFQENPNGLFSDWNPNVSCQYETN